MNIPTRAPMLRQRRAGGDADGDVSSAMGEASLRSTIASTAARRHSSSTLVALALAFFCSSAVRLAAEGAAELAPETSDFDAMLAERVLGDICADGARVIGSQRAEVDTVLLLTDVLQDIATVASAHGASLEVEVHRGSGVFYTDFLDGFTNAYRNATTIAARLSWPRASRDAILLAAHYDSFPTSPGASDNAVNVAACLGVLKALAAGPALSHSFLVLLNGGEESMFVAAHAFATQHRWAADYRVVVNLEAIGAGGASVVFQLGPDAPWLAHAIGASRHRQRGTVIAHDLFQVRGFPAGTDWKTLLRHAPVARGGGSDGGAAAGEARPAPVGLDMATLGDGYVYHTPLDLPRHLSRDHIASLGDGTLSIVRALDSALAHRAGAAPTADGATARGVAGTRAGSTRRPPHENAQLLDGPGPGAVYFDYCALIWVAYSAEAARLIHLLAALLAAGAMVLLAAKAGQVLVEGLALLAALAAAAILGLLFSATRPLATFGSDPLVVSMYGPVALGAAVLTREACARGSARAAPLALSQQLGAASLAPWLLLLLLLQAAQLGTAYLPAFYCAVNGAALLAARGLGQRYPRAALAVQLGGALLPTMHVHGIAGWLLQVPPSLRPCLPHALPFPSLFPVPAPGPAVLCTPLAHTSDGSHLGMTALPPPLLRGARRPSLTVPARLHTSGGSHLRTVHTSPTVPPRLHTSGSSHLRTVHTSPTVPPRRAPRAAGARADHRPQRRRPPCRRRRRPRGRFRRRAP